MIERVDPTSRPIVGPSAREPREIWSRRFGDEYMGGYTTECGYGFLVRWIADYTFHDVARLLGRRDLLAMQPLRRHRGYVYISGLYVCAALRGVPRAARESALRGWFTPIWMRRVREERFSLGLFCRSLLLPLRDRRSTPGRNRAALARHARRVREECSDPGGPAWAALSDAELVEQLERVETLGREHFRIIRWGMGGYASGFHAAARAALAHLACDESGELYAQLTSGLEGTSTGVLNRDLWQLGELARANRTLLVALRENEAMDELRSRSEASSFWPAFDDFLRRHGHRGASREISQPRWSEVPENVLALVRAQVRTEVRPASPVSLEALARSRREAAWSRVRARLGRGFSGWIRALPVAWLCRRAREFTEYRENQREVLDIILARLRAILLEQGRRLVLVGVLEEPFEVFLLEPRELRGLLGRPVSDAALRARIEERHKEYERERLRLPASFLFDGVESVEREAEAVPGAKARGESGENRRQKERATATMGETRLSRGIGVSRGVAQGCARVLLELPELARIENGEILVAANIDPAWTNVFPMLAGIVSETGGPLSHGALLAREYGIPAVMGVPGATRRITTGESIRIDGAAGTLEWI